MKKSYPVVFVLILIGGLISSCSSLQIKLPVLPKISEGIDALIPATPTPPKPAAPTPAQPAYVPSLSELQSAYEQIYEQVLPSVVSINVTTTVTQNLPSLPGFPFDFNLPEQDTPRQYQQQGAGSGFVWDTDGHIVTNNHVVRDATSIRVQFSDGTSVMGEMVGADTDSDLAVIKVDVEQRLLKPVQLADSTQVKVGQIAVAIGNPFQLDGSMTVGIVSATGRSLLLDSTDTGGLSYSIPDVIQTDAAINPGNSGGVLVDINGHLIGVTTAIESPVRANTGIGYVVPSIIVQKVVPVLIEKGDYDHPWIGISGRDLIPEVAALMDLPAGHRGALVVDVTPGSPAEKAGFIGSQKTAQINGQDVRIGGDVITAVDGQVVNDFEDLVAYLARYAYVDQTLELTVVRDGKEQTIPLTLAARPRSTDTTTATREASSSAWLGIIGMDLTSDIAEAMNLRGNTTGVLIQQVTAGSPADGAGLRGSYKPLEINGQQILVGGDIVIGLNDVDIENMNQLSQIISTYQPDDEITLTILRDGREENLKIVLGERPQ